VLRSPLMIAAVCLLLGCGGATPAPSSAETSPPPSPVARADLAATAVDEKPSDPHGKEVGGADVLEATKALPPGDLAVVFMNNVDGEIEPCG
jgi:hypothetical protein